MKEEVKVLSESEIQEKLYGRYLGPSREKKSSKPQTHFQADDFEVGEKTAPQEWTGAEILIGELDRLRSTLITLRQERQEIADELDYSDSVIEYEKPESEASKLGSITIAFLLLILIGLIGFPMGARLLQASPVPVAAEPSPYTVQVAVYDVRSLAERALDHLEKMGYQAFLVEFPRSKGNYRYRIYVGRFVTKTEAEQERVRLTADSKFSDAFVRLK